MATKGQGETPETEAETERPEPAAAPRPLPKPIRTVRRTLVRPDGSEIAVDVPVYPPFRLEGGEEPAAQAPPRRKRTAKPRPTGSD